jgi:uncharacterized SAM-binding protein YcdF (DUF218 family)
MLRGLLWLVLLLVVPLGVVGFLVWPTDDVPADPDAVVVLGGADGPERAELGVRIAEEHDAVLVLASNARYHAVEHGYRCDDEGVRCFEPDPVNTIGEARNVAVIAAANGWEEVAVVTSRWHTSRARVGFRQCVDGEVHVVGTPGDEGAWPPGRREVREALGTLAAHTFRRAC